MGFEQEVARRIRLCLACKEHSPGIPDLVPILETIWLFSQYLQLERPLSWTKRTKYRLLVDKLLVNLKIPPRFSTSSFYVDLCPHKPIDSKYPRCCEHSGCLYVLVLRN